MIIVIISSKYVVWNGFTGICKPLSKIKKMYNLSADICFI